MSAATVTHYVSMYSGALEDKITPETELHQLDMDSLDRIQLVIALEDEFLIEISDAEAENLKTVADVIALVERKGGAA